MAAVDAERALALVGVPFRPQGRDPATGLDCVGLCLAIYGLPVTFGRSDYRLRGNYRSEIEAGLSSSFRRIQARQKRPGDLLLMAVSEDQLHLGVLTGRGLVHADAGLRRVVETPGEPSWPVIGVYRRRVRK
jgi:lipoprotein Spr